MKSKNKKNNNDSCAHKKELGNIVRINFPLEQTMFMLNHITVYPLCLLLIVKAIETSLINKNQFDQ